MNFREITAADLACVLDIERHACAHPWTEGNFNDCLNDLYEPWLLESSEGVIGYGIISVAVGEAHLLNICVAKRAQGKGYGRHIIHHLIQRSRELNAEKMFLEVRESNTAAIDLYLSEGYQKIGVRKNYYPFAKGREHAIVMSLALTLDCHS
jgi:ribosomal-protein-alanine N-acetyltransferase